MDTKPWTAGTRMSGDASNVIGWDMRPKIAEVRDLLLHKPDGSNRICIDYRKLSKITKIDPEPIPAVSDVLQRLNGDRYFSNLTSAKDTDNFQCERKIYKNCIFSPRRGITSFVACLLAW